MKELRIILPEDSAERLVGCIGRRLDKIVYLPSADEDCALDDVELHFDEAVLRITNRFEVEKRQSTGCYPTFEVLEGGADFAGEAVEKQVDREVLDVFVITDSIKWGEEGDRSTLVYDNGLVLRLESGVALIQRNVWFSDESRVYIGRDYTSRIIELGDVWKYDGRINPEYTRQVRSISAKNGL